MDLRLYVPKQVPWGAVYLIAGLHFQGTEHPEIRRFASILAHAGILVALPEIPDFVKMHFNPRSIDDAEAGLEAFFEHEQMPFSKTAVMSISLGSRLAIALCARNPDRTTSLITFGGYQDWKSGLKFCLAGNGDRKHDPLNRPILFSALRDQLPSCAQKEEVVDAWLKFAIRTWGRDEMKNKPAMTPVAKELSQMFDQDAKSLFLQGLGLKDGGDELIHNALRSHTALDWLDCTEDLARLQCRMLALHATQDDVIECEQSTALAHQAPSQCHAEAIQTGMYVHSGRKMPRLVQAVSELKKLFRIVQNLLFLARQDQLKK
jgi:pimeloyl-ACP methyl ester carboxylesterase